MFAFVAVLSFLLTILSSSDATPVQIRDSNKVTLHFAHKVNALGGLKNLAEIDRARASTFISSAVRQGDTKQKAISVEVANAGVTYTSQVGIGTPPTKYTLLIDTGSSNTWVLGKKYVKTKTSKETGGSMSVQYGLGFSSGVEYIDTVTLAPGLIIEKQSFGVVNHTEGFKSFDGILGIGPVDLTTGLVSNEKTVPTVTDNLYKAGEITSETIGIFYRPVTIESGSGELTWGGVDMTKVKGNIDYVPVTKTYPASRYWGVDQSVMYNGKTILSHTAGILDTGTGLVLLATDAFKQYQATVGGIMDKTTGLLQISSAQYSKLQNLDFKIGRVTYTLTPNAQIWPRSLNTALNGDAKSIYLIVGDLGTVSGRGLDFINGYVFLERFYSVYDTGMNRVGLATTQYTTATTN